MGQATKVLGDRRGLLRRWFLIAELNGSCVKIWRKFILGREDLGCMALDVSEEQKESGAGE